MADSNVNLKISVDDRDGIKINGIRRDIKSLSSDSSSAAAAVGQLAGAFKTLLASAAVAGLIHLGKQALDTMDRIDELSQKTGVAAESIQVFGHAGQPKPPSTPRQRDSSRSGEPRPGYPA